MTRAATPLHLWIVGIVSLLWNLVGAFDYLMTQFRVESYLAKFTPEQLDYYLNFPAWIEFFWALAIWSSVVASILLLLRIRWAGLAFMISLVSMVVTAVHNWGFTNAMEISGTGGLIFTIIIFIIAVLLVVYTRWMCKRDVIT